MNNLFHPLDRIEEKILPEPNTGCWLWTAALFNTGYSAVGFNGKTTVAHRVIYEHHKGPIPNGLQIDHLCRVRCCVNPDHLEAVTQRENMLRGESPSARHAAVTRCPYGHPYDDTNTYVRPDTKRRGRDCRKCKRNRMRAYRAKRNGETGQ